MSCLSCLEGVRVYITSLWGDGDGRGNSRGLVTHRVVPMPLTGTSHMNTSREIEENVLRQLEREGILARRGNGGVSYSVGNPCEMFTIAEKKPRHLPAMEYDSQERTMMASIVKEENLKKKGKLARISELRKLRAEQNRKEAQEKKLERIRSKQDRLKRRFVKGKP